MKSATFPRESQVRLISSCYENENMGRARFGDWFGSQGTSSRCAGGIVIIVREGGRLCASESEVACLSSPFRTGGGGKGKKKKERFSAARKYV